MYCTSDFTDQELLIMVNDIYDWDHNCDCIVKPSSLLRKMYDEKVGKDRYPAMGNFADDIVREAADRFEKLIKVTMRKCAYKFVAR